MISDQLPLAGNQWLYLLHLFAFGFRRDRDGNFVWQADEGGQDGLTVVVTPSGWCTWLGSADSRPPVELITVGELRRFFADLGAEPWF